ncbi:MAG: hypothetical protein EPO25_13345 [Gammaproteobacteria bacterium]|nr:MAG: hypothetical protein EPO25_13345 [Gammaproteobacteria bacterium]
MKGNFCSRRAAELAIASLGLTSVTCVSAFAADGPPQKSADQGATIEAIVVTAQRRQERTQDVPVSVQVIGEQVLVEKNLVSLPDIAINVPAVHIYNIGRAAELFIRGIGSSQNPAFDQSVGMFVDDIYHGRSRTSLATFLDLERVEILRGPQSTFFGNNAIAGAFSIVTRKPGNEFDFSARAAYQPQAKQYVTEAAVGGPLGDTVFARAAINVSGQEGWMQRVTTGVDFPREENQAGRVTLLFQPNADLDATLKVEGGNITTKGGRPERAYNCPPPAPYAAERTCLALLQQGLPVGLDQKQNAFSDGQGSQLDTKEGVLTVNFRRSGHTLTSVTGYYAYDYNLKLDTDMLPAVLVHVGVPEEFHQFSQEFRVASQTGGNFEYMAGVYYQTGDLAWSQNLNFTSGNGRISTTPSLAALIPYLPIGFRQGYEQDEKTSSAFGSLTWNATDRLKLNAGLRATRVKKSYDWNLYVGQATNNYGGVVPLPAELVLVGNTVGLGTAGVLRGDRSDNDVMPSARVQYQLAPGAMAYLSYSEGFKAGTFNGSDNTANAVNMPLNPEYVSAYEAGLKTETLGHKLLLNLAVFRSDYSDLQVTSTIRNPNGTFTILANNAAAARSQGVELEGQWAVSRNFRLAANLSYLDSKWLSYPNVSSTLVQTLNGLRNQDLSGRPTPFAPKWSGTVGVTHQSSLAGDYQLTSELNVAFSSSYFLSATDDDFLAQDRYVKWGGRLTLDMPGGHWAFDLIGKNLNDRAIKLTGGPAGGVSSTMITEQPRNVTIQARYNW